MHFSVDQVAAESVTNGWNAGASVIDCGFFEGSGACKFSRGDGGETVPRGRRGWNHNKNIGTLNSLLLLIALM